MAEWLRRLTRNQIPSGSTGSNPVDCETCFERLNSSLIILEMVYVSQVNVENQPYRPIQKSVNVMFDRRYTMKFINGKIS